MLIYSLYGFTTFSKPHKLFLTRRERRPAISPVRLTTSPQSTMTEVYAQSVAPTQIGLLYYSRCEVVIRQENLSNMSCVPYENTMQIYEKFSITK